MPITAAPGRPVMAKTRCGDQSPRNLSDLFCAHEAHDRFPHEQGRGVLRERKSYRDGQGEPRTCRRKLSECWTHGRESAKDRGREAVVEGLSATSANRIVSAGTGPGSREAHERTGESGTSTHPCATLGPHRSRAHHPGLVFRIRQRVRHQAAGRSDPGQRSCMWGSYSPPFDNIRGSAASETESGNAGEAGGKARGHTSSQRRTGNSTARMRSKRDRR